MTQLSSRLLTDEQPAGTGSPAPGHPPTAVLLTDSGGCKVVAGAASPRYRQPHPARDAPSQEAGPGQVFPPVLAALEERG